MKSKPTKSTVKKRRGFAAMSEEDRKRICCMGGRAIAKKKGHMAKIGARGGANSRRGKASRKGRAKK